MKREEIEKLLIAIILVQAAGLVGSIATFSSVTTWYKTLAKPAFTPPSWIFGPVWTALYLLMGIALYRIWDLGLTKKRVRFAFWLFIGHLVVNAGWSIVFFGLHSILGGFLVLCVLWALIAVIIWEFWSLRRAAAYLLVPYFLWVTFAGALNLGIWLINR